MGDVGRAGIELVKIENQTPGDNSWPRFPRPKRSACRRSGSRTGRLGSRGRTGDPTPVTVGGHDGLYLELAVPADLDVTECVEGRVERWRFGPGDRRWQSEPGELDRIWILDVEGQRVVINAVHTPGASQADIDKLTRTVRSITFTTADTP